MSVYSSCWYLIIILDTGYCFFERSFYKGTSMEAARFLKTDQVRQVGWYKSIIFYEEFIVPQEIEKLGFDVKIHTKYNIYHDYDDFSFLWNLRKKFYYWKSLLDYKKKQRDMIWVRWGETDWNFSSICCFL